MKSYIILLIYSIYFLALTSCHNHKEGDGHDHGASESKKEEHGEHSESEGTIASLTDEQIKSVGIELGSIELKELTSTMKANGNLKVPNGSKGNATSLYGGVIKSLNVQIGSHIRKGQVIATIANPQFIQLQEEYLTIGNKIIFAEQELTRQKELNEGNAGALKNFQSADAELKYLRTRKVSLGKQIELMGINPSSVSNATLKSSLSVLSPITGTVSNVFAKIGSYVDVSSPVAEIVDNGSLHLDLSVFEKDLPLLKIGQTIHFTLTNNPTTEYDAMVYSIGTAFENESKTIPIHCTVRGNKSGLIDGMNITAIVSLSSNKTQAVPNDAIVNVEGKDYIFIVTNKNPEEHHKEEGGDEHGHSHRSKEESDEHKHEEGEKHNVEKETMTNFEKIEVVKGISNMGYTAITPLIELPKNSQIVNKGAFFINAKMTNQGEGHSH
jgi:cobalt-zinc-cadmium efflux system membrane fusion protein